ncbi:hypothetical protein DFP72DRAFT_855331 [Ephemerocybe angulata]|uniref:Uncharacterized protein n=1 Tax=Ephemerocybe angulata TaxID=980116 RepID=A0A8H6HG90_9AGAR|nr:hypothetical protein DFP72DRAFT_855331 [Tulosesus angulatus]
MGWEGVDGVRWAGIDASAGWDRYEGGAGWDGLGGWGGTTGWTEREGGRIGWDLGGSLVWIVRAFGSARGGVNVMSTCALGSRSGGRSFSAKAAARRASVPLVFLRWGPVLVPTSPTCLKEGGICGTAGEGRAPFALRRFHASSSLHLIRIFTNSLASYLPSLMDTMCESLVFIALRSRYHRPPAHPRPTAPPSPANPPTGAGINELGGSVPPTLDEVDVGARKGLFLGLMTTDCGMLVIPDLEGMGTEVTKGCWHSASRMLDFTYGQTGVDNQPRPEVQTTHSPQSRREV